MSAAQAVKTVKRRSSVIYKLCQRKKVSFEHLTFSWFFFLSCAPLLSHLLALTHFSYMKSNGTKTLSINLKTLRLIPWLFSCIHCCINMPISMACWLHEQATCWYISLWFKYFFLYYYCWTNDWLTMPGAWWGSASVWILPDHSIAFQTIAEISGFLLSTH